MSKVNNKPDLNSKAPNHRIITGEQLQRLEKLSGTVGGICEIIGKTYIYAPISSVLDPIIEDLAGLLTEVKSGKMSVVLEERQSD